MSWDDDDDAFYAGVDWEAQIQQARARPPPQIQQPPRQPTWQQHGPPGQQPSQQQQPPQQQQPVSQALPPPQHQQAWQQQQQQQQQRTGPGQGPGQAGASNGLRSLFTAGSAPAGSNPLLYINLELGKDQLIEVKCGHHEAVSAALKRLPGGQWDPKSRHWRFPLTQHDRLVQALQALTSVRVRLEPLHPLVTAVLRAASSNPDDSDRYCTLPKDLEQQLMPFQREGVKFALRRGGRVLIGDEMGLGKTVQAIAVAAAYRDEWPLLVIAPSSLREAWADALHRWLNLTEDKMHIVHGGKDAAKVPSNVQCLIISYNFVQKMDLGKKFRVAVVADESHSLKESSAQRTKATIPLIKEARRAILLSGTPALNKPKEIFQQLSALVPSAKLKMSAFGERYCQGNHFDKYGGASNLGELNAMLKSSVLVRRLKRDVLTQLPSKRRQQVILCLDSEAKKMLAGLQKQLDTVRQLMGEEARKSAASGGAVSGSMAQNTVITELYKKTAEVKAKAVQEYVQLLLDNGQKFLIFAHHTSLLDAIEHTCNRHKGCQHIRIDGSTPPAQRQSLVNKFQENADVRVAILSIKAAGTGLTLTAASTVVFAEMTWTPGEIIQAEDRAHRIGQASSVNVIFLFAKGSSDDLIWASLEKKLDTVGEAIDGEGQALHARRTEAPERGQMGLQQFMTQSRPGEAAARQHWQPGGGKAGGAAAAAAAGAGGNAGASKSPGKTAQATLHNFFGGGRQPAAQQQQQQQQQGPTAAAAYQQYYQQAAAAGAAQPQQAAGGVPAAAAYYPAAAAAPTGLRQWVGTVTQIIPPNYGVVDGDAYYINAVAVGQIPQVGEKVRAEGVPHNEGSYKWRVTRLELESAAAAAAAAAAAPPARTASMPSAGGAGGPGRYPARSDQDRQKLREEAAGKTYNTMAPPVAAYTSEVALASVESSLAGGTSAAAQAAAAAKAIEEKRALLARTTAELDEEARKKAEQAVAQLGMDPAANPGAKMLARMGFGTTGTGLGRNQQGISAPIDPVAVKGGTGLGFDLEKAEEEERAAREARRAEREARDREDHARRRERDRDRERRRSRSRSPGRSRYSCAPPKWPTYEADRGVAAVSKRYKDLYLPADFVKVRPTWQQCCPETNPFPIDRPISFEVKGGEQDNEGSTATPGPREGSAAPSAAATPAAEGGLSEEQVASGRLWSARVVLVSGVNPANLQAGEKESKLWVNPLKKLTCLLLKHDKREYGMVGGHWEPQDGGHPASDPAALTRTAARHFKTATGLDLSGCTQWVPFCEYSYLRPESTSKGLPQRTEHVVVYLVDAWTLATHNDEADVQLQKARAATSEEERAKRDLAEAESKLKSLEEAAKAAAERASGSKAADGLGFEGLDPPAMNVQQLQEELTKRGLDTKWNPLKGKKELVDRLQEWIAEYKVKRAAEDADFRASEEAKAALEAQKEKVRESDKGYREARSAVRSAEKLLLDPPPTEKLILHPAGSAVDKKGRSLLKAESLDALLDYDDEDNREGSFEVALFAELFQEMLQQRFGRAILRALDAIDAAKPKRSSSRRDGKDEGKEDSKAAPGSASKKRERSAEPAGADVEMADAEKQQAADAADSTAAAKRQKTEAAAEGGAASAANGVNENLLTACRFYDRDCAGYLADEDLEEIAYMVSDSLSRKRVQGLVDSVTKRSKFSYLEHASLMVPPAEPPAAAAGSSGGNVTTSEGGVVVINGMAVDVPALQQRLAAADAARRAAEDGQRAAEQARADALAEKQRAQESHEEAVLELAKAKEQLAQLAETRSQADMDTSKARVVLQAAELGARELTKQLAEAMAALGGSVKEES
ncbi:SWI SNF-related matrix-associated actin-dependent regulator of chromatin subfamily A 1 isoform X1 [Chlorella sorokiniana]|uniref:SWI SNF-related matrix-associated actin-dependent regulator of chromatin subfamily A 1 isoform X1 n=2 Tax=Eukaryota TaxID=2759 RepID=A0A2P6TDE4_CHLSO|nr:SWI SNF-related matrix-associated actin-dependent regulator of chromatin subfamily A 1 isoform X1 [Chlorella sorokiniana]|eukprot:PRW20657.1 SWI SNF-related matrix-associated actin-dependent regulator of chromatin subfamily A 1 isoform X1 [Chlorella sorokiniana]